MTISLNVNHVDRRKGTQITVTIIAITIRFSFNQLFTIERAILQLCPSTCPVNECRVKRTLTPFSFSAFRNAKQRRNNRRVKVGQRNLTWFHL